MKYSETIEPLDNEDRKIFYRRFMKYQLVAYLMAGGGLLAVIYNEGNQVIFMFILSELIAIGIFLYVFLGFRLLFRENKKVIIRGEIQNKKKNHSNKAYYVSLKNHSKEIQVEKNIYDMLKTKDYVTLHKAINMEMCHRVEKIIP